MACADTATGMAAVAFETTLGFEHRLRAVANRPEAPGEARVHDPGPGAHPDIEGWELQSELVLVCPEVRKRAMELLPERDPDAFLARPRAAISPTAGTVTEAGPATSLPVAVLSYALWRLIETARSAVLAVGGAVVLALIAEIVH
jgi:hypothetical protein